METLGAHAGEISRRRRRDLATQVWLERCTVGLWLLILMSIVHTALSPRVSEDDLRSLDHSVNAPVAMLNLLADIALALVILPNAKKVWATLLSMRPLVLFMLLAVFSSAWSVNPAYTLRRAAYLNVTVLCAAYFGMRFTPMQIGRLVVIAVTVLVLTSCVVWAVRPSFVLDPSHPGEWMGLSEHKNVFGQFVGFGLCFLLLANLGRVHRIRLPLAAVFALMLYLSHSTTCWLLTLLCIVAVPVISTVRRTRTLAAPLAGLAVGILLVIALLTLPLTSELMQAFGKDPTLTGRTDLWAGLLRAAVKRPLWGYGYEAFFSSASQLVGLQQNAGWLPPHAHNGYLQVLIGTGAAGGLLTLWLIADILVTAIRFAQRCQTRASLAPLIALLFWLVHNSVEVTLMQGMTLLPFTMFALLASMNSHPEMTVPDEFSREASPLFVSINNRCGKAAALEGLQ